MRTDHVNCTLTLLTTSHHVSPFFPDFVAIFTLITILGNAHRPCKLYFNNTNNSTSCLSFFSWFFPDFLIIFTLLTILGNAHRPCLHLLSIHNNLTTKEYIVQKKPCHLDHNWQSYIETFIFAKNDDQVMTCAKDHLNLRWVQTILGARHPLVVLGNINRYKQLHRAHGEVVCICFEHCENNIRKKIL